MSPSSILRLLLLVVLAPAAWAQTAEPGPVPAVEQNEAFRDTLVKMRIKREESEHKKLLDKTSQIRTDAGELIKLATNGHLPKNSEKKLRDIEKSARHIRSEAGGGNDNDEIKVESRPESLAEALQRLQEAGDNLNDSMGKTSRHVVSLKVIDDATDIIRLVKLLRSYLN